MKKIILFGGSFNPVHEGHVFIARKAIKFVRADELWFIPTFIPALKEEFTTSFEHRVNMLNIAIKNERKMKVSLVESQLMGVSYTVNTIKYLKSKYPNYKFYFLMGTDQFENIEKWKNSEELFDLAQIIVVNRDNKVVYSRNNELNLVVDNHPASSTSVREGNFNYLNYGVNKYIANNALYFEDILKHRISEYRYNHSLSVITCGLEISEKYDVSYIELYIACLLHDIAKECNDLEQIMECYFKEFMDKPRALWHAYGGYVICKRLGIENKRILNAIRNHVDGNNCKTILDKIVFCSDKLEESRGYDSRQLIRLCRENIDEGFKLVKEINDEYVRNEIKMRSKSD